MQQDTGGSGACRLAELHWALERIMGGGSSLRAAGRPEIGAVGARLAGHEIRTRRKTVLARLATAGESVVEAAFPFVAESLAWCCRRAITRAGRTKLAIARRGLEAPPVAAAAEIATRAAIGESLLRLQARNHF